MAVTQSLQRRSGSVREDECDLHVDPVFGDLAVTDHDLLILDPGAFDMAQVLSARAIPWATASSKLTVDDAVISVTRATDMGEAS
jgi:hypothetical protein